VGEHDRAFVEADRLLDCARTGPLWLRIPDIAKHLVELVERGASGRQFYELHSFVVMPNHVHPLITPLKPLPVITRWLKGASAHQANQILHRKGNPFWQDESFDHWVRSGREFDKIKQYIEENPVKAGLVKEPGDWPYSSARRSTEDTG
jgi:REP element-mobilizing transposase RayT